MPFPEIFSRWSPYLLGALIVYAFASFLSDHPHVFLNGLIFGIVGAVSLAWVLFGRNRLIRREVLKFFGLEIRTLEKEDDE